VTSGAQISVSGTDGSSQRVFDVRGDALEVAWGWSKADARARQENIVSVVVNRNAIVLCDTVTPENLFELQFDAAYGPITRHRWFGDGYMALSFQSGQVVIVSSRAYSPSALSVS
jgi:hypothetical protein